MTTTSSKKLHGNGRWESSRMMLPEHREQYIALRERDKARDSGVNSQLPASHEELQLMHDSVLLPMAIAIAEKNRNQVGENARSLRPLFVKATELVIAKMNADLSNIRRELSRASINVRQDERVDGVASYRYTCRGHDGAFAISRDYARTEIGTKIAKYIAATFT